TPTVMRLLYKAHKGRLNLKSQELISVFSRHPKSGPTVGWIFEARVHELLEQGINVPLDPMAFRRNTQENAVNDSWRASNISNMRWQSGPMRYMPYTTSDRTLRLEDGHYYVPIDPSFATFDSFTFESTLPADYDGPILSLRDKSVILDKVPVELVS